MRKERVAKASALSTAEPLWDQLTERARGLEPE
jgi:hypothetical protein